MELYSFETVDNLPCLYHPEMDLLVISDLHLGLEGTMTREGNYVPEHQLETVLEEIEKAGRLTDADRILVNGDLKNEFKTSYKETEEVEQLLKFLKNEFEDVILTVGNHDTFLESTVDKYGLELREHYKENQTVFTHGHIGLDDLETGEYETIVLGHEHPALALEDEIGVREKVDCFLHGYTRDGKNIIVLPAFSDISNGTSINETPVHELLSPILKQNVDVKQLKAIAVSREGGLFRFPQLRKI